MEGAANICDYCDKLALNSSISCMRCNTYYCSVKCQLDGFKSHKPYCEDTKDTINYPRKENICNYCDKGNCKSKCGRKCGTYYCSRECQKADWPSHKVICDSQSIQNKFNLDILRNLADSHGVYIIFGDKFRKFIVEDLEKYVVGRDAMIDETNKLLLAGSQSILERRKQLKIAANYLSYLSDIRTKYGLVYKESSLESWKEEIMTFDLLKVLPEVNNGYLKFKNKLLLIKQGKIEETKQEIEQITSNITKRFAETFTEIFEYINMNPKNNYNIDVLEFSLITGIYAQYHYIHDLTKDKIFLRGKVFIMPLE